MNLTLDERTKIFDKVCRLVETKHFNPAMNGVDWNALVRAEEIKSSRVTSLKHSRRKSTGW